MTTGGSPASLRERVSLDGLRWITAIGQTWSGAISGSVTRLRRQLARRPVINGSDTIDFTTTTTVC
jgi:hypothetical protein